MSRVLVTLATTAALATPVAAQEPADSDVQVPRGPAEVATIDGIVGALYDVISGPPGERDWDRFQSLFLPDAILLNAGPRPDTAGPAAPVSPQGYRERTAPYFRQEGFFESELARTTHRYGTLAQIWSTYEARSTADGPPFTRGINSIVMVRHAGRWWIASVIWDSERPDNPLPEAYLPGGADAGG